MIIDLTVKKLKKLLTEGLISTGCNVEDVGLSLSPMVYFAQFNLKLRCYSNGNSKS